MSPVRASPCQSVSVRVSPPAELAEYAIVPATTIRYNGIIGQEAENTPLPVENCREIAVEAVFS